MLWANIRIVQGSFNNNKRFTKINCYSCLYFTGHQDAVSGLVFQEGTHDLFSGSFDRTVKSWSLDDMGYLDTLFGHQAEVLSIDMLRNERAVTSAADRTCRVWKISESSQLVFR